MHLKTVVNLQRIQLISPINLLNRNIAQTTIKLIMALSPNNKKHYITFHKMYSANKTCHELKDDRTKGNEYELHMRSFNSSWRSFLTANAA